MITKIEAGKRLQEHFNFINDRIKINYQDQDAEKARDQFKREMELMDNFLDIIFSHEVQNDNGHQS